ncbi:uncharacterized protein [Amphiura filiformis]|uniref:uncharacterized protein n=1 Tax=Amphiura filiformis TaxID=82378 RepID=UPI003B20F600
MDDFTTWMSCTSSADAKNVQQTKRELQDFQDAVASVEGKQSSLRMLVGADTTSYTKARQNLRKQDGGTFQPKSKLKILDAVIKFFRFLRSHPLHQKVLRCNSERLSMYQDHLGDLKKGLSKDRSDREYDVKVQKTKEEIPARDLFEYRRKADDSMVPLEAKHKHGKPFTDKEHLFWRNHIIQTINQTNGLRTASICDMTTEECDNVVFNKEKNLYVILVKVRKTRRKFGPAQVCLEPKTWNWLQIYRYEIRKYSPRMKVFLNTDGKPITNLPEQLNAHWYGVMRTHQNVCSTAMRHKVSNVVWNNKYFSLDEAANTARFQGHSVATAEKFYHQHNSVDFATTAFLKIQGAMREEAEEIAGTTRAGTIYSPSKRKREASAQKILPVAVGETIPQRHSDDDNELLAEHDTNFSNESAHESDDDEDNDDLSWAYPNSRGPQKFSPRSLRGIMRIYGDEIKAGKVQKHQYALRVHGDAYMNKKHGMQPLKIYDKAKSMAVLYQKHRGTKNRKTDPPVPDEVKTDDKKCPPQTPEEKSEEELHDAVTKTSKKRCRSRKSRKPQHWHQQRKNSEKSSETTPDIGAPD